MLNGGPPNQFLVRTLMSRSKKRRVRAQVLQAAHLLGCVREQQTSEEKMGMYSADMNLAKNPLALLGPPGLAGPAVHPPGLVPTWPPPLPVGAAAPRGAAAPWRQPTSANQQATISQSMSSAEVFRARVLFSDVAANLYGTDFKGLLVESCCAHRNQVDMLLDLGKGALTTLLAPLARLECALVQQLSEQGCKVIRTERSKDDECLMATCMVQADSENVCSEFMKLGECSRGSACWWGHPGPLTVVIRLINSEEALAASQLRQKRIGGLSRFNIEAVYGSDEEGSDCGEVPFAPASKGQRKPSVGGLPDKASAGIAAENLCSVCSGCGRLLDDECPLCDGLGHFEE